MYPATLADGTVVQIVSKGRDANGNEVFTASDGAKYTRSFGNGGNDATTLYEYDEALGEKADDPFAALRATEGVSISDIHSQNRERAAAAKAELTGADALATSVGGELVAQSREAADAAPAADAEDDPEA